MVKLRLKRIGRRHCPCYRISAMEVRNPRDGRVLEELGSYDPMAKDESKQVTFKADRVQYWLEKGAVVTDTLKAILKKNGINVGK